MDAKDHVNELRDNSGFTFTHKGLLLGIYPVWLNSPDNPSEGQFLARPGWPEWPIDVLCFVFELLAQIHGQDPDDFFIPITVTGTIE